MIRIIRTRVYSDVRIGDAPDAVMFAVPAGG
jgi:hypothetical protein